MTLRAFVAGATGYTGREVARRLRAAGVQVYAHVRPDSTRLDHWQRTFTDMQINVDVTPWRADAMAATLANLKPDVILCLIGTTAARARRDLRTTGKPASYEQIDYGLTALLVDAAKASCPDAYFIYLSAVGASPRALSPYGRWRYRAEEAVRESGLSYTIARPSFITGPTRDERRVGERVAASTIDGVLGAAKLLGAKKLHQRFASMDNSMLARALVALATADDRPTTISSDALRNLADNAPSARIHIEE